MNLSPNSSPLQPRRPVRQASRLIALAVLATGIVGCTKATRITTNAAGHPVTARIEGSHSIDTQGERGVIVGEYGKVTIERTRMQLNDSPWTKIPENASLELVLSKHKISATTGSITVSHSFR